MQVNTASEGQRRARRHPEDKDAAQIVTEIHKGLRKHHKWLGSVVAKVVMGQGDGLKLDQLRAVVEETESLADHARRVMATIGTHLGKPGTATTATPTASATSGASGR